MKYIIEHLEEEYNLWADCEYKNICRTVGVENCLFTNVQAKDFNFFTSLPHTEKRSWELDIPLERICLLDLRATETLSPEDSELFDAVVFGGILGDTPPRDRTGCLRRTEFSRRQLGALQMSTDSAVKVCHQILDKKKKFEDLKFSDTLVVESGKNEVTELEFRYLLKDNGDIDVTPGLIDILKANENECFF